MVKIYTKNKCPQCKLSKQMLDRLNIKYTEINTSLSDENKAEAKQFGKTAPIISFEDTVIFGFDIDKIRELKKVV